MSGQLASLRMALGGRVTLGNLPVEHLREPAEQHPVPAQSTCYQVTDETHQCSQRGVPHGGPQGIRVLHNKFARFVSLVKNRRYEPVVRISHFD